MSIIDNLTMFGMSANEAEVYSSLIGNGWLTALQLSHKCPVKRTTLYRLLEGLLNKGLIEEKIDDKRTYYAATTIEQFERLIKHKEDEAKKLREMFPDLKSQLSLASSLGSRGMNVRFYRGIPGLQHLQLKATVTKNTELLIFDSNQWSKILSDEFAEEVRGRIVTNNILVKEIHNSSSGNNTFTKNNEYYVNHYQHRVVDQEIINISQDIYIFDETIQLYGYNKNDIVGIEIESREYARMVSQMFEVIWKVAEKA